MTRLTVDLRFYSIFISLLFTLPYIIHALTHSLSPIFLLSIFLTFLYLPNMLFYKDSFNVFDNHVCEILSRSCQQEYFLLNSSNASFHILTKIFRNFDKMRI